MATGDTRALAEICAKRAKGFGLDISYRELSFNESDGSWYDGTTRLPLDVEFCDCLTEFVFENIGQIRDLDISIGEQSISRFALQVHDPAFALEKLRVTFHCDLPNPGILANLYSGPNLKDLFWNANGGGTNFPRMVEFFSGCAVAPGCQPRTACVSDYAGDVHGYFGKRILAAVRVHAVASPDICNGAGSSSHSTRCLAELDDPRRRPT